MNLNPLSWFGQGADPGTAGPYGQAPGTSRGLVSWVRQKVGAWLGPTLSRGTPQEREVIVEKVARGPRGIAFPHFLPYHDDNYTNETPAMRLAYRRMLADPNVSAAFRGMVLAVAALDLNVVPSNKKDRRAQEVADFVRYCLTEHLAGGVPGMVWSILSGGMIDGYSVLTVKWARANRGCWSGKYVPEALKAQDVNNDLVLQTDEFGNLIGAMGLRYNAGLEFSPAELIVYRHQPLYNSPTGLSAFRCVYSRYWLLDTVLKLRGIAADKRAMGAIIGEYPNPTVQASLDTALSKLRSQFWASVPRDTKIQTLDLAGAADNIYEAFSRSLREEIVFGIQTATLQALTGGEGQQRGDSQVHKDSKELSVWHQAASVEALLNDRATGFVRNLVDLNFVVAEYPRVSLSAVDPQEQLQELQLDTGLKMLGLDLSKNALYEKYNRSPPEEEDDRLAGGPPQPGGGPGGGPGAPGAQPLGPSPGGAPGGEQLPFDEGDAHLYSDLNAGVGAPAWPFRGRRFSEGWQRYLAG